MRLNPGVNSFFFLIALSLLLSDCFAAEKAYFYGEINANNINLRSDATASSAVIATLSKGYRVQVVLELYDWYKVRLPKNVPVYIKDNLAECISYSQPSDQDTTKRCLSVKVLRERVNVRLRPDSSSPIVGIVDKNEIMGVLGEGSGWYKVVPAENSFGWVHKRFVNKASDSPLNPKDAPKAQLKPGEEEKNIVITGIIKPYGVVFRRIATHKLIAEGNKVYLLKGDRRSLDALNNHRVKIVGNLDSSLTSKIPVLEIKIVEVIN
jgi:uncharacterized protein YgiM (DUF1202 family)